MYNDVLRKLKYINNEDIVWYIYFFIIIFALVSNKLEKYDLINNTNIYESSSKKINTTILIVAFFIYLYFVIVAYDNFKELKKYGYNKKYRVAFERLIASIIFLIGGAYTLYADYDDNNTDIDLAIF